MYLAGYIERLGTGTSDMVARAKEAGLKEPDFIQTEDFRTVIYRISSPQVTPQVEELILELEGEKSRDELQEILGLKDRENFRKTYVNEALKHEMIEMIIPDKPKSKNQKYRLTAKGKDLQQLLKKKI